MDSSHLDLRNRSISRPRSISTVISNSNELYNQEISREISTVDRPTRALLKELNNPSLSNLLTGQGDSLSNLPSSDEEEIETITQQTTKLAASIIS